MLGLGLSKHHKLEFKMVALHSLGGLRTNTLKRCGQG